MKTKIRTLIGIIALGIIGFTNINATSDNYSKREIAMRIALESEKEESLAIEPWMIDNTFWSSTSVTDTVAPEKPLEIESWMLNEDLWK